MLNCVLYHSRLMPESIRWLLSAGRKKEAVKILEKVAKQNKANLKEGIIEGVDTGGTNSGGKKATILDILKNWRVAILAFNIWFNWMANALVHYGLSLNTTNLAGDPYLNFFIAACVEIPSLIIALFLLDKIGRRRMYIIFLIVAAAGCISSAFIPSDLKWVVVLLSMIGKFAITGSYAVIYLMAAELFPTVVRNVGVGMSSVFSRVGGMVAPQVVLLGTIGTGWLPLVIFGAIAIAAAIAVFFLPETAGKNLPENLDDLANMKRRVKSDVNGELEQTATTDDTELDTVEDFASDTKLSERF